MPDPNNVLIKELTLKTASTSTNNRLSQASKQIKDCMIQLKTIEVAQEMKTIHGEETLETLILNKGTRRDQLDNLVIRPNLIGKKTIGNLEIHQNGLRYSSTKGQKVDICFSNIKHCFYQPCAADEIIVIIHFHLYRPILLGNKRTQDV